MLRMPSPLESRHRLLHWERINPAEVSYNGHWIFSQSRTMSLRRSDLMAIVMETEEQIKHHVAHILIKKCIKRGFEGNHDRFQNDSTFRESLLSIDRTEEVCIQMTRTHFTIACRKTSTLDTKDLVDLSQYIWQKWTDETPFRLQRSINKIAPSSPWVWRRATRTDSFLAVPEMAPVVFFIQHILVAVERFLVELMNFYKSQPHLSSWKSSI